jgi:hypothetical protein
MKDKKLLRTIQMRNRQNEMGVIGYYGSNTTKLNADSYQFDLKKLYNYGYKSKYAQYMYIDRINFLIRKKINKEKVNKYLNTNFKNYDSVKSAVKDVIYDPYEIGYATDFLDVMYDITIKVNFDDECNNNNFNNNFQMNQNYTENNLYKIFEKQFKFVEKVIDFYKNNKEQIPEKEENPPFLECQ